MSWSHLLDAGIFILGMICAFTLAVWVEARSSDYARDFDRRYRRDRAGYAFDRHCTEAGVVDRRSLLPGRWAA